MGYGETLLFGIREGTISFRRRIPPSIYPYGNYCFDLEFDINMMKLPVWFQLCLHNFNLYYSTAACSRDPYIHLPL